MIKNLNRMEFAPYGRLLGERQANHGFPSGSQWVTKLRHISAKKDVLYRCSGAEVYLDFHEGMAILLVSKSLDIDAIEAFYLDKPVCIYRGIRYCVLPFDDSCEVFMCTQHRKEIRSDPLPSNAKANAISFNMEIGSIRTLFYQEKEDGFFFKGEAHRQYELTYMDKGSMRSIVGGQEHSLAQGEMILYGPNQWHSQCAEGEGVVRFLTITFDMDCNYADILLNRKFAVDTASAALLNHILEEARQMDIISGDLIRCHLMQFLLNMIRGAYCGEHGTTLIPPYTINNENQIVDQALRYIADNIYEKLSVGAVAIAVNVSTSYLSALFSRHLKIRPSDYIRREKLEESKRLIRFSKMNFTQIAEKLKYSSVYHFSSQFKSWYGMTPSEFVRGVGPLENMRDNQNRYQG